MDKQQTTFKDHLFSKVFVLLVLLVGLSVNVYLAISATIRISTKAAESVEIFFSPETVGIPPDTVFRFMLNPNSQGISFLETTIKFDQNVLQLSSNPVLGDSNLFSYQALTPFEEANQTGIVRIILLQRPGASAPANTFEVFSLPITFLTSAPSTTSYITVVDEETQVVDRNAQPLDFAVRYATVRVRMDEREATANQQGNCPENNINTAIGCIPVSDSQKLAEFWLRWGLGIAGGIALILIVYSGYLMMTSQGDPHRLESGKELLTAALMGLVLLVFGAFILRFIGVDILQITGN